MTTITSTQLAQARHKSSRTVPKKLTHSHSFYSKKFIKIKLKNQTFSIFSGDYLFSLLKVSFAPFVSKIRFCWRNFLESLFSFRRCVCCFQTKRRVFFFQYIFSVPTKIHFSSLPPVPELYFLLDALLDYFTFIWELMLQGPSTK